MADVKLNSLATKTNANAAAILVKDSATQGSGGEGWITKAQLSQIIRDEIKAQMSAITSGTPDVPVLDGNTLKYMTLANFAKVAGELHAINIAEGNLDGCTENLKVYKYTGQTMTYRGNVTHTGQYGVFICLKAGNYTMQIGANFQRRWLIYRVSTSSTGTAFSVWEYVPMSD